MSLRLGSCHPAAASSWTLNCELLSRRAFSTSLPQGRPQSKPSISLPTSPIVDSAIKEAKLRFIGGPRKPSDITNLTPIRSRLYNNPYARFLAKPPRKCNLTDTVLPCSFLLDMSLVEHPQTKKAWFIPSELQETGGQRLYSPRKSRLLNRMDLVINMNDGVARQMNWRLLPERRIRAKISHRDMVWRDGMADIVLEVLQRKPLNELYRLMSMKDWDRTFRGLEHGLSQVKELAAPEEVHSILWTGPTVMESDDQGNDAQTDVNAMELESGAVPVIENMSAADNRKVNRYYIRQDNGKETVLFDLPALLGRENMKKLRDYKNCRRRLNFEYIAVQDRPETMTLIKALWALQGYLSPVFET